MKISLKELRNLIQEAVDWSKAMIKLDHLADLSIENPANAVPAVVGLLRSLGMHQSDILDVRSALQNKNKEQAMALIKKNLNPQSSQLKVPQSLRKPVDQSGVYQKQNNGGMKNVANEATGESTPTSGLGDNPEMMEEILAIQAEGLGESGDNLTVSEELMNIAKQYDDALWTALQELVEKLPPSNNASAEDLWNSNAPYLVLMTLKGEGVGIWDGEWDNFYDHQAIKPVQNFLKEKLHSFADDTGSGSLNDALTNIVFSQ